MQSQQLRFGSWSVVAALSAALAGCSSAPTTAPAQRVADPLNLAIAKLDHAVFDAFNKCSDEDQREKFGEFFAKDAESYRESGATFGRKALVADVEKNYCGKQRRVLVDTSLKVYEVEGFGAIETGQHRFCSMDGKRCGSRSQFTLVWRKDDDGWQITRALGYGQQEQGE